MKKNKPMYFTQHQIERMAKRGISKAIVEAVVEYGVWRDGKNHLSYEIEYKGVIVVLYEQQTQYNVASTKLNRENTIKAEQMKEQLEINFFQATHKIVKQLNILN